LVYHRFYTEFKTELKIQYSTQFKTGVRYRNSTDRWKHHNISPHRRRTINGGSVAQQSAEVALLWLSLAYCLPPQSMQASPVITRPRFRSRPGCRYGNPIAHESSATPLCNPTLDQRLMGPCRMYIEYCYVLLNFTYLFACLKAKRAWI